ncbi:hypothetical protein BIFADO_00698 [Bifidobacterium adolescentis L2-32]|uniref:Uncharacterized protein n=1 Tax=Bifidobacterium adolescentis L2-32 TaxID=411481 RepID=A7A4E1_BIFAD|nr:hypothetical protein BIFADO_00698 [Bifidobacterium adolescentis L2-32]
MNHTHRNDNMNDSFRIRLYALTCIAWLEKSICRQHTL